MLHFSIIIRPANVDFSKFVLYTHKSSSDVSHKQAPGSQPSNNSEYAKSRGFIFAKQRSSSPHQTAPRLKQPQNASHSPCLALWVFPVISGFSSAPGRPGGYSAVRHWQLKVCSFIILIISIKSNQENQQSSPPSLGYNAQLFRLYPRSFSDILIM